MIDFSHGGNLSDIAKGYGLKQEEILDFSANINPMGVSKEIKELIARKAGNIAHYPDPGSRDLVKRISSRINVNQENILVDNGSSGLIYLLANTISPKKVVIPIPSYSEYERAARLTSSNLVFPRPKADFKHDLKLLPADCRDADLLFLGNPNNPTATLYGRDEILLLLKKCEKRGTILVVDEAFMDFVKDCEKFSSIDLVKKSNNLVVLKSLTKFFAIPGLRLGYLVAGKDLVSKLRSCQPNWPVNYFAQIVGRKFLDLSGYVKKSKEFMEKERERFFSKLKEIVWLEPFKPTANFIFCKITDKNLNSKKLKHILIRDYGILIRDCSNFRGLDDEFIRLAIRLTKDNNKIINCLKQING
ncbi:MAG: threonine-phosphate decarboxylase CobD [Candidatus Humimicrobiaceae bacterium]